MKNGKKIIKIFSIISIAIVVCAASLFLLKNETEDYDIYEPIDLNNVIIKLQRTGGTNEMVDNPYPIYSITIYGNGTVIYEGKQFVNITERRISNINQSEIRQLISEFEKVDFFSLDVTNGTQIMDASGAILSLTINEKTRSIEDFPTDETLILHNLEDKIDEIVNSRQWIH